MLFLGGLRAALSVCRLSDMPHTRGALLERLPCTKSKRDRSDLAEVYDLGPLLHQPAPEMEADVTG